MNYHLAYTYDTGPVPLIAGICAITVMTTGIIAIKCSRTEHSVFSKWILVHILSVLAICSVGFVTHYLNMSFHYQACAKLKDYTAMHQAYELNLYSVQALWFALIATMGFILGVVAVLRIRVARQVAT